MARGHMTYEQRMRAARVSKHVLSPVPEPTLADTMATVYHQRWAVAPTREVLSFSVLARDAAHAVVVGELRLTAAGMTPPFDIDVNIPCPEADFETRVGILQNEPAVVKADRERRWQEGLDRSAH